MSAKAPEDRIAEAEAILRRHKAVDRETRVTAYRNSGWTRFDASAPAYSSEEIERERATYGTVTDRF